MYVYTGPGTSRRCCEATVAMLQRLCMGRPFRVATLSAQELVDGSWRRDAQLVCMPGGRDVPYLRRLGDVGAAHLRAFVHDGGSYLGFCAGGYFAAQHIVFAPNTPLAVTGLRPLRFFAGEARGPLMRAAAFAYHGGQGAELRAVRFLKSSITVPVYNYGGCSFGAWQRMAWPTNAQPLAVVEQGGKHLPVCMRIATGRGRVLLWGMHPEFNLSDIEGPLDQAALGEMFCQTAALRQHLVLEQLRHLCAPR